MAPIVLNDERVQKYLKQKAGFYSEYSKIKIEGETVPKYFSDLYKKYINYNNGFEVFLRKAYQEIKKNKKLFKIYLSI